jgi:hypothetical protein
MSQLFLIGTNVFPIFFDMGYICVKKRLSYLPQMHESAIQLRSFLQDENCQTVHLAKTTKGSAETVISVAKM